MIQDFTIYYEKCFSYCGSNDCPNLVPYYKQLNALQCVSDCSPNYIDTVGLQCVTVCPYGYIENSLGNICDKIEFCSSTCDTCSANLDQTMCTGCSSTLT